MMDSRDLGSIVSVIRLVAGRVEGSLHTLDYPSSNPHSSAPVAVR